MNGIDIIILIIAIVVIAAVVGAFVTREQKSLKEMTEKYYVNDKLEELPKEKFQPRKVTVQPATRQINEVVKDAVGVTEPKNKVEKNKKSEFPIDQPKKKRKYYPKKK
jgi:hypothetical protein